MRRNAMILGVAGLLSACGSIDQYEAQVKDFEPIYCYQSLAGTECYRTPYHRDERRLVNYFGPHPSRYEKPEPPVVPPLKAPETVNYWVKDPEPVPRPMPHGDLADRPWLTAEGRAETRTAELKATDMGTMAFLRTLAENAAKPSVMPDALIETAPAPAAQPVQPVEPAALIGSPHLQ